MPRRALILAGGGLKVAFQAGVLQVWLDEAAIEFERADAASGGLLNAVQWCAGRTGAQIADGWRDMHPWKNVDPNWRALRHGAYGRSLFRLERFRRNVVHAWNLDWDAIRTQTSRPATCNVFDFTQQRLRTFRHSEMTEELLLAGISLPGWFPPVVVDGHVYVDAVYATDANLEAAIRDGANELWIVWTVSTRGEWRDGAIAQYFQTIEAAANSRVRDVLQRIECSNARIAAGGAGEFDHHVECKVLEHEVPMHYLFVLGGDRTAEAVELGVEVARLWCDDEGLEHDASRAQTKHHVPGVEIHFVEHARGHVTFAAANPTDGEQAGAVAGNTVAMRLVMTVEDVARFVRDPHHHGSCSGTVRADVLGRRGPWNVVKPSFFELMVEDPEQPERTDRRLMLYRLFLENGGERCTLVARKTCDVDGAKLDIRKLWSDTTTFDVDILPGHVAADDTSAPDAFARGRMHLTLADFLRQMTTYRTKAHDARKAAAAIARFDAMFVGHLWDVYLTNVLSSSPF